MTNYAIQEQNQDLVSLLAAHFRLLYNPTHAMADAIGMLQMFPGLVGLWPGSALGNSAQVSGGADLAGGFLHLTNNNAVKYGSDGLAPYMLFDGTNHLSRADEAKLDISGTGIFLTNPGLTMGAWVYPEDVSSGFFMSKGGDSPNRAYDLLFVSGVARCLVSGDGSAAIVQDTSAISANQWTFICMKYIASTSLSIWANGTKATNTTSIPASIFNSSGPFNIGARNGADFYDGRVSLAFLSAAAIPDIFINTYFQMTAPLFGISV